MERQPAMTPNPAAPKWNTADQLFTRADLLRRFNLSPSRFDTLMNIGALPGPDIIIPGSGHKAARWSATRVNTIAVEKIHEMESSPFGPSEA